MILLRGGRVWGPQPLGRCDVLVGGGRILAVGEIADLPAGLGVEEIDVNGLLVLPGLVDVHAHLTGGGGEGGAHTRVPPVGVSTFFAAGVTTAIGLLGTDCTTRTVAENLACARGLEAFGLTALCYTGGYPVPPVTLTGSVRGDIVHVDRIVAVGEIAISDHRSSQPTYDEIVRIAADAHVAGMMTGKAGLLHLHLGDGPRGLDVVLRALQETELPARTFHPTHCNRNRALWAAAMELGRRGGFVDVTAFPDDESAAEDVLAWIGAGLEPSHITMSSDAGGCMPDFDADGVLRGMGVGDSSTLLRSVAHLVGAGLPVAQAIAVCTENPARLFRLHRKGRVVVGADADLLVVDPSFQVRELISSGQRVVDGGQVRVRGMFEGR